jgi:Na+/H+ antiporter NhaD/arsenite permease-like protein
MYALMAIVFIIGYLLIVFEHSIKIDKAASALLTAVVCWTLLMLGADVVLNAHGDMATPTTNHIEFISDELRHHLGEISEIIFFLLGAMTIVGLVDAHDGFDVITSRIKTTHKIKLLWLLGLITFFLSAVMDNLTTAIVMVALLRKLIDDQHDRWFFAGMVIIAANAGGAWSPIGDVTTTMLWIDERITALNIIKQLFLPSLICLLVPLVFLSFKLKGDVKRPILNENHEIKTDPTTYFERNLVFVLGIGSLMFVPVFKTATHLPPYMGILLGLGILWIVTEILHRSKNDELKHPLSVVGVLRNVDTTSVLFFLGILLAVSSLATAGHLNQVALLLKDTFGNIFAINLVIGLLSAVVDNVPLVAGAIKMYPLVTPEFLATQTDQASWYQSFMTDGKFWELLAYCAGTGGSCLIIGSAAGVAAMGMERISFFWYLKNISLLALLGYLGGAFTFIALSM